MYRGADRGYHGTQRQRLGRMLDLYLKRTEELAEAAIETLEAHLRKSESGTKSAK